jgi:hypothetical protein
MSCSFFPFGASHKKEGPLWTNKDNKKNGGNKETAK